MEAEARARRTLYVGGLEESLGEGVLRAAFLPFGEIKDVNMPMNHATGKNRGFGFVEFEEEGDAREALDNMEGAELYGRSLKVTLARPQQAGGKGKAVWSADEWFQSLTAEGAGGEGAGDDAVPGEAKPLGPVKGPAAGPGGK